MDNDAPLSVHDIARIREVIDLACSRGAFRANEMSAVGEIYDKVSTFINRVVAEAEKAQAAQTGEAND